MPAYDAGLYVLPSSLVSPCSPVLRERFERRVLKRLMATCSHPERLVSLLYDGELSDVQRREVALQLADCPTCTGRGHALGQVQDALAQTLDAEVAHRPSTRNRGV